MHCCIPRGPSSMKRGGCSRAARRNCLHCIREIQTTETSTNYFIRNLGASFAMRSDWLSGPSCLEIRVQFLVRAGAACIEKAGPPPRQWSCIIFCLLTTTGAASVICNFTRLVMTDIVSIWSWQTCLYRVMIYLTPYGHVTDLVSIWS